MKNYLLIAAFLFSFFATKAKKFTQQSISFLIENKGQIKDEKGRTRKDIDFVFRADGLTILVGAGRLEYVFNNNKISETIVMQLGKTQKPQLIAESNTDYYENYYLSSENIEHAKAAERICYKNIYPNIDWVLYLQNGKLEHEFVCNKGAKHSAIRWTYEGAVRQELDEQGDLKIACNNGEIKENIPECFDEKGQLIHSSYQQNNHTWAYLVATKNQIMTIDPSVEWSTYQNSSTFSETTIYGACTDKVRSIYVCGTTTASTDFASASGVYQSVRPGAYTSYVSKFDTSGKHIWTTYYGGEKTTIAYNIDYYNGFVVIAGFTTSTTGIATTGTSQSSLSIGMDADNDGFIAKLDTNGMRIWGTYCGGNRSDDLKSLKINDFGEIYVAGQTLSRAGITTIGAFKPNFSTDTSVSEAILLKYNQNGGKIWGTYIGGEKYENGESIYLHHNIVYISGPTYSATGIATAGSYQPSYFATTPSSSDLFLMQFDSSGIRNWGTYYGGNGFDTQPIMSTNKKGDIFLYGTTTSTNNIASIAAYQTKYGGNSDCFLAKFDSLGKRYWGTYIGGAEEELSKAVYGANISVDDIGDDNNVYITGITKSTGLATSDAFKDTITNLLKRECFIASISGSGIPYFFSYFGGEDDDEGSATVYYNKSVYLAGRTLSGMGIATAGAYKTTSASAGINFSGFLTKINSKSPVSIIELPIEADVKMKIYPNPAKEYLTIDAQMPLAENGFAQVSLYNIVGKKVQTVTAPIINGKLVYQMQFYQTLQAGVYYIEANYKDWQVKEKIIKE